MSGLKELCCELHNRLRRGEPWDDKFRSEVFTHPSLVEEAKQLALRYHWIDKSLDVETAAWAVLAEGIITRAAPPRAEYCVPDFITMLKRWFLRLPQNWLRKDREKLQRLFDDKGKKELLEAFTDHAFEAVNYYDQELLEGAVIGWIRELKQPVQMMAMMRFVQELTYKDIAKLLKLSEANVFEQLQSVRERLLRKILQWREEN